MLGNEHITNREDRRTLSILCWMLGAILLLVNFGQATFTPLIDDEAYYWMWSRRMDWGYYDHPPLVAVWIGIGSILGHSVFALRFFAGVSHVFALYLLTRSIPIQTKKALWLWIAILISFLFVHVYGFVQTPDTPLFFFVACFIFSLKRFLTRQDWLHTILLSLSMAGLMYSKYHGALVIFFALLPLIPKFYRNIWAYVAIALGVLWYSPHLWWQWQNEFVSFQYHIVRRNVHNHFELSNVTDYLLLCLYGTAPLLFVQAYKALVRCSGRSLWHRSLAFMAGGVLVFFLFTTIKRGVQAQWIMAATLPMAVLTYEYYLDRYESHKWIFRLAAIMGLLLLVARVLVAIPDPPFRTKYPGWEEFMHAAGEVSESTAVFDSYQGASLFTFYNHPEKEATRVRTLEYRASQFDLWQAHESLQGKDFTFFDQVEEEESVRSGADLGSLLVLESDEQKYYEYGVVRGAQVWDCLVVDSLQAVVQ